jgi:hypothetical protein
MALGNLLFTWYENHRWCGFSSGVDPYQET